MIAIALPAFSATTYYNSNGTGSFTFDDFTYGESNVALPQFNKKIAKGSVLNSVLIDFTAYVEAGGGTECDSQGNSELFDNRLTVSILGSTFSGGRVFGFDCGPFDAIDFSVGDTISETLEFSSMTDNLKQFIGKGTIPFLIDLGENVTAFQMAYSVEYSFVPRVSVVPLPATGGLLTASLLGLIGARRKYRNKHA